MGQRHKPLNDGPYTDAARSKFLDGADPWLIAKARTIGATVVTHEVYQSEIKRKVPIPNICRILNVNHADTFEVLRQLSAKFVFEKGD